MFVHYLQYMYIERIYTGCLSEAAYYIESGGEAAIVDPMREPQPYLELAARRGATIRYVFETHFHADFVSGHIDIARQTGASIVFGPGANADYDIYVGTHGEEFQLGVVSIKLLHTPGHTLESSCFLLMDERHNPHSVFTGDTLFVGDVGRPDLAVNSEFNREQLAGILYDSIESKLKTLPNYVVVFPGHGAGSACGKSISSDSHSTIGIQKETNYALKAKSKEEFIKLVTDGLAVPPGYFFMDAVINRKGYDPFDQVMQNAHYPLTVDQIKLAIINTNTYIIDTRSVASFVKGYIPGSIFIGLEGNFAPIAGTLLDPKSRLILVAENGQEKEAITRLVRIGYENIIGFLDGGFNVWHKSGEEFETIDTITAEKFEEQFRFSSCTAIDVRNPDEWVPGFVSGARLISLQDLESHMNEIDQQKPCFVYCAGGYRSMIATSLLKRRGFKNVVNVLGGMKRIRQTPISIRQLST